MQESWHGKRSHDGTQRPFPTVDRVSFKSRKDRSVFVYNRFRHYLTGTVLDVGCDQGVLREFIGGERYCGLDMTDGSDVRHNLEENPVLPFPDESWDAVLCIEVLEHLDNLHTVWSELVRVSKKHLVVTFPNCWNHIRARLRAGYGSVYHYGIPAERPSDRHKWFFSLLEALEFVEARARQDGLSISEVVAQESQRPALVRWARRLRYPAPRLYLNRYANMLACVLTKTNR